MSLTRLKPAVPKHWLIAIAGLVWSGAGGMLCRMAWGWLRPRLRPGDRVWVTRMEHHANFLPWQRAFWLWSCRPCAGVLCSLR